VVRDGTEWAGRMGTQLWKMKTKCSPTRRYVHLHGAVVRPAERQPVGGAGTVFCAGWIAPPRRSSSWAQTTASWPFGERMRMPPASQRPRSGLKFRVDAVNRIAADVIDRIYAAIAVRVDAVRVDERGPRGAAG